MMNMVLGVSIGTVAWGSIFYFAFPLASGNADGVVKTRYSDYYSGFRRILYNLAYNHAVRREGIAEERRNRI